MIVRSILSDPGYAALKAYILNRTGLAYYTDKDEDLAARISRRLAALKAPDCSAYLAILDRHAPEIDALVGELTIGETYFFRQSEHFELLRSTIIPELLRRNRDNKQLRIWSAGCATGAEPYSVAMLLQLEFAERLHNWEVFILGTDINVEFLAQARTGIYSEWALRDMEREVRDRCFQQEGKRWKLNDEFRAAVTFRHHNLADGSAGPSPDGVAFDLIFCRNVMIYFSQERTRSVAAQFLRCLADGGWLLVGHAEHSIEVFGQFELVQKPNAIAYRKPRGEAPPAEEAPMEETPMGEVPVWQPWCDTEFASPESSPEPHAILLPTPCAAAPELLEQARLVADRGDWTEAEGICQKVLEADPLNAPAHFTLGLIRAHTGSLEAATAALRRAIYVDRGFSLAHYHLGALLQAAKRLGEARKAFRNVIRLLQARAPEDTLEHGDGIKVEELRDLTRMHQEVLGE